MRNLPLNIDNITGSLTNLSVQISGDKIRFFFISQSWCLSVALLLTLELDLDSSHRTKNAIYSKPVMFQANFHVSGLDIKFLLHAVRAVTRTKCLTMI